MSAPRGVETVLVVDDSEMVRTLIGEGLRTAGHTVLSASEGATRCERSKCASTLVTWRSPTW